MRWGYHLRNCLGAGGGFKWSFRGLGVGSGGGGAGRGWGGVRRQGGPAFVGSGRPLEELEVGEKCALEAAALEVTGHEDIGECLVVELEASLHANLLAYRMDSVRK